MGDINSYELGLDLKLKTKSAEDALNSIENKTKAINDAMTVASEAFAVSDELKKIDQMMSAQISSIESLTNALEEQYAIKAEEIRKDGEVSELTEARINRLAKAYSRHRLTVDDMFDKHVAFSDFLQKKYGKALDSVDIKHSKIVKSHEKAAMTYESNRNVLKQLTGAIMSYDSELKDVTTTMFDNIKAAGAYGAIIGVVAIGLLRVKKYQDEYRLAGMRQLGTIEELIDKSNQLGIAYGASQEEQIDTMKALTTAGFKSGDSIKRLSGYNFMFSRTTGVSAGQTAILQQKISLLTKDASRSESVLNYYANIVRKLGLNASEASEAVGKAAQNLVRLNAVFDNDKAIEATKQLSLFTAALNKVGLQGDTITDMIADMTVDSLKYSTTLSQLGLGDKIFNVKDPAKFAEEVLSKIAVVDELIKPYGDFAKQLSVVGDILGVDSDRASQFINLSKKIKEMGGFPEFMKSVKEASKDKPLPDLWAESIKTLSDAFSRLKGPMYDIFIHVGASVAKYLAIGVNYLADYVLMFKGWLDQVGSKVPGIKILLEGLFVGVIGVGAIFTASAIFKLTKSFLGLSQATKSLPSIQKAGFLASLAEGIKSFGAPGVLKGIVNLGIAMTVFGTVLLGMAVIIKKFGLGIKEMVVAAAGIVLMSTAFALSAVIISKADKAITTITPKLIAFGASMGILAIAAIGFAYAFNMVTESLGALFTVVNGNIGGFVAMIGATTIAIGGLVAAITAFGASGAVGPFAVGVAVIGGALYGLGKLISGFLSDVGESLPTVLKAVSGLTEGTGKALESLGYGLVSFVKALFGGSMSSGITSAISSLFGGDDLLERANKIAAALTILASPLKMFADIVSNIPKINVVDMFEGLTLRTTDILTSAMALQTSAVVLADLNGKMATFNALSAARPIRKPLITDFTARLAGDKNNANILKSNDKIKQAVEDVADSLSNNKDLKSLNEVVSKHLPDLSKGRSGSGFTSSITQWL
jgi:hypothetical protein